MDHPRPQLRLEAVAARVVAWHNRHPLARRITAAQVHSIGLVALPFAVPASAAGAAAAPGDAAAAGAGADAPAAGADGGGSLRERALARARSGRAPAPAATPAAPAAPAAPATSAGSTVDAAAAAHARPNFDEDFIAPLTPRQVARFARRHGVALAQPPAQAPLREVIALPLAAGEAAHRLYLLTAAIEADGQRQRVLLGAGGDDGEAAPVLGRRLPSRQGAAVAAGVLAAPLLVAGVLRWAPGLGGDGATLASAGPAASAASAIAAAPAASASAPSPDPIASPSLLAGAASAPTQPAASAPTLAALPPPPAVPEGEQPLLVNHTQSLPPTAAASAPLDVEPTLGKVALPPLGLSPEREAARLARLAARAAAQAASAASAPGAATATAAAASAPAPGLAARQALLDGPPAFAVASRVLRTRTEAEQVRDAIEGLLRANAAPGSDPRRLTVEVFAQGDDWRVVGWPFEQRGQADKARTLLVSRGLRVEVVAF
jgi:hypothetical protein